MWYSKPPTYDQWLDAKNHGAWWIKFRLTKEEKEAIDGETVTWPETWLVDIVTISNVYEKEPGSNKRKARLHARGAIASPFYLDDPIKTKDTYWQPAKPPENDIRDQRPTEVDGL